MCVTKNCCIRQAARFCCAGLLLVAIRPSCWGGEPPTTHPLLPGLRSPDLQNPAWPRTLHDNMATGFSPLACGMNEAPQVWCMWDFGGTADWLHVLHEPNKSDRLLVYDGRLRLVDRDGAVKWTAQVAVPAPPTFYGVLGGGGRRDATANALLFVSGPQLLMFDPNSGVIRWTHEFGPPHVQLRVVVMETARSPARDVGA
jgi:hypothetical protein